MNNEYILKTYGIDGKFFFLTRDCPIEITTVGGGYGDVDIHKKGCLFFYANQWLEKRDKELNDEIDRFGRNYLDRVFIELCIHLHFFISCTEPQKRFTSLTARKEGEKYMIKVLYDDVDLEMEVEEMYIHFRNILKDSGGSTT